MSDYVVLLHGIGRGPSRMEPLTQYLKAQDYTVYNMQYRSMSHHIEILAENVFKRIQQHCPDKTKRLHFVTYSMGGIVTRYLISKFKPSNLGRVVMIAPPNHGSEVIDFMQRFRFFRKLYGPAGLQIGTGTKSIVHQLEPIDYELGVIAGSRTIDPWFSWFVLPGKSDGKVTIESTKLAGMQDHIIIPASHTFIPKKLETFRQVSSFLANGKFLHQ